MEASNHSCLSHWELLAPMVSGNLLKHLTFAFLLKAFHWFIIAYWIKPKLLGVVFKSPANLSSLTSCHPPMGWVLLASGSLCCFFCLDTFSHLVVWRNFYSTLKPLWKTYHVCAFSGHSSTYNNHSYHLCSVLDMQYWLNPNVSLESLLFYTWGKNPRG